MNQMKQINREIKDRQSDSLNEEFGGQINNDKAKKNNSTSHSQSLETFEKKSNKFIDEMIAANVEPTHSLFGELLRFCMSKKDWRKATRYMDIMLSLSPSLLLFDLFFLFLADFVVRQRSRLAKSTPSSLSSPSSSLSSSLSLSLSLSLSSSSLSEDQRKQIEQTKEQIREGNGLQRKNNEKQQTKEEQTNNKQEKEEEEEQMMAEAENRFEAIKEDTIGVPTATTLSNFIAIFIACQSIDKIDRFHRLFVDFHSEKLHCAYFDRLIPFYVSGNQIARAIDCCDWMIVHRVPFSSLIVQTIMEKICSIIADFMLHQSNEFLKDSNGTFLRKKTKENSANTRSPINTFDLIEIEFVDRFVNRLIRHINRPLNDSMNFIVCKYFIQSHQFEKLNGWINSLMREGNAECGHLVGELILLLIEVGNFAKAEEVLLRAKLLNNFLSPITLSFLSNFFTHTLYSLNRDLYHPPSQ